MTSGNCCRLSSADDAFARSIVRAALAGLDATGTIMCCLHIMQRHFLAWFVWFCMYRGGLRMLLLSLPPPAVTFRKHTPSRFAAALLHFCTRARTRFLLCRGIPISRSGWRLCWFFCTFCCWFLRIYACRFAISRVLPATCCCHPLRVWWFWTGWRCFALAACRTDMRVPVLRTAAVLCLYAARSGSRVLQHGFALACSSMRTA